MSPINHSTPPPPAVAAFLRGLHTRAWLLARVQAGAEAPARHAMAVVERVFAADAGLWPIAQWPQQYWRLLLATPPLRQPAAAGTGLLLPGIARLPVQQRAAVLLLLVAGLDEDAAASALGVPAAAYQQAIRASLPLDGLGQPDVDVWRAWQAAAKRALAEANAPPMQAAPTRAEPTTVPVAAAPAQPASPPLVRWLWLGVALCAIALGASLFLHPQGRAVLERLRDPIKREALAPAPAPKARFDPNDPALHPDRERLAAPREAGYADQLAMLAWLAEASSDLRAADAVRLPLAPTPLPAVTPAAAAEATALSRRIRQWQALPQHIRGLRRAHWQAWRALDAGERMQLRIVAQRFEPMSADAQLPLQQRFDAQASDARAGWWLGPRLGRDWPRVSALFAYVDAGERTALLRLLRQANADDLEALARLAQSTAPEARADLRRELLALPAGQRTAWLQARALR